MNRILLLAGFLAFAQTMCLPDGYTQETGNEALLKRIEQLEKKVVELSTQLTSQGKDVISDEVIAKKVEAELAKQPMGDFLSALRGITLSGYVDSSYTYNFNVRNAGTNTARVFDREPNSFVLQSGKLAFEKLPDPKGGVGFRTDLLFGSDAEVINPTGWTSDEFDVETAYVDMIFPIGKGLNVKAGKFPTLAGAEVIEAKDNYNFSRSLLFGYAIPFTHTGVRASYRLTDALTGYLGINNGWDVVEETNKGKTVESSLAYAPKDWLSFNLTGLIGPEQASNNHSNRSLVDFIATVKPFEKLTLKVNTDYAYESDGLTVDKKASWNGVAGYARYDFTDWLSLSNRVDYFNDRQGVRIVAGTPQELWGDTLTLEIRPFKNLITRLEYRYDQSSEPVFVKNDSEASSNQSTIGFEAIYMF